MTMSRRF